MMRKSTVSWLLRTVLLLLALGVVLAAGVLLPTYMRHVCDVRPALSGAYGWIVAFGWLLAVPGFLVIALMWKVFESISGDRAFSEQNALRFKRVWQLAAIDTLLVAAMGLFLLVSGATPPFLVMCVLGLLFLGVCVILTAFALSGLCHSAAALRDDCDMTI